MAGPTPTKDAPSEFDALNAELDKELEEESTALAEANVSQEINPASTSPAPPEGLLSKAGTAIKKTGQAIAAGVARVIPQTAGATIDTGEDLGKTAVKNFAKDTQEIAAPGSMAMTLSNYLLSGDALDKRGKYADVLSARSSLGQVGYSGLNQGIAEFGSLVLGFALANKAAPIQYLNKLGTAGKLAGAATAAGASTYALQDPTSARLTTALGNLGVHSEFTDWLGEVKPNGPLENRFKNALEGMGVGLAFDSMFLGAKYLWTLRHAPNEAPAALKEAQEATSKIIPEQAQPQASKTEISPEGTVSVDGEPAVQFASKAEYDDLVLSSKEGLEEGAERVSSAKIPPLNDPANVAPLLRQMAIDLHDTPHVVKPDAVMYADAANKLKEIGLDPQTSMAAAEQIAGQMTGIDSAVTAIRTAWRPIATEMDTWTAKGIDTITEEQLPELKAAIHNAITYSGYFANIRSQSGRLLRSLGLEDLDGYLAKKGDAPVEGQFAGRPQVPLPQTRQEIGDFMEMWNATKNRPDVRMDFLQGVQAVPSAFKYMRTSFANWFTASALSGIPSIMMNTVGPTMVGALHTMEKTLGGTVVAMTTRDPKVRAEAMKTARFAAQAYFQTMGDIPNVLQYAIQAMSSNRSILGGGGTVNDIVSNMGPITPAMLRMANSDQPVWGYALGNAINFLPRQFQRLNAGLDELAKRMAYNGETRLQALVDGSSKGLKGDDLRAFVKEQMQASIEQNGPEVGSASSSELLRSAERTTLTGSLANEYHPNVSRAALTINALRREVPEFRFIAPVFNVPANSVGETLRRIPVLNFLFKETREELMGDLGTVRQADAYGRTIMGGMFMLYGYHLAREGLLTGGGPKDPRDRKIWELSNQPYSVKIGDKWVSYARYDQPGALFAIPAVLYDRTVNRSSDRDMEVAMLGGVGALAQYFKDKAALQGISQVLDFGAAPSSDLNYLERTFGNIGARMAVPNFVTQLGRNVIDPQRRTRASIGDYIADALPWQSKELDPVRNVLGEPQFKPNQSLIENALPITITSTRTNDPVIAEMDRLYEATGYGAGVTLPTEISGGSAANGFYDPREITLENGRSMYDAIIEARSRPLEFASDGESTLRKTLQDLFASDEYLEAVDGDATSMFDSNGNVSKAALLKNAFSDFNRAAVRQVAAESAIARRYLAVGAAKRINGDALRPYSVQRMVDTPDLLKALNIDIEEFEEGFAQ